MKQQPTYSTLLGASWRATLLVLIAKVLSVVIIANLEGAAVELRTFASVIPYLSVGSEPRVFLDISTHSTLVMALVGSLYLVPAVIVPSFPSQRTWGRLVGVVITAETMILQVVIHYLVTPTIRPDRLWWIVMVLLSGVFMAVAGLGFTLTAPRADPAASDRQPAVA